MTTNHVQKVSNDIVTSALSSYFDVEIYADGYDDEYRGNAQDRAWLDTLTEREREAELLKRHEQREILNHRYEKTKQFVNNCRCCFVFQRRNQ